MRHTSEKMTRCAKTNLDKIVLIEKQLALIRESLFYS